jgi:hypothetical protein
MEETLNSIGQTVKAEDGFVLILAMVMLLILTMLGTFATKNTLMELQISGNDKVAKQTFYQTDGGGEAGIQLVEENLSCPLGFTAYGTVNNQPDTFFSIGGVDVFDGRFAYRKLPTEVAGAGAGAQMTDWSFSSDAVRSLRIPATPVLPANRNDVAAHTNIALFTVAGYATGTSLQMAAGYEGKGHGAATGGGVRTARIVSSHLGANNSRARVLVNWTHVIGQEGSCLY